MNRLNKIVRSFALVAATLGLASLAYGQAGGGGAGGAGGGGGAAGGVGGTAGAGGQAGTGKAGVGQAGTPNLTGVGATPWFSNAGAQQHLNMNTDQYNNLNNAYTSAYTAYQKGINNMANANLSPTQKQQRMDKLRQQFYTDFDPALDKYLTNPGQRQRYNELNLQYQGYNAFSNPKVADKLNLTKAQRDQLNEYQQQWMTQMGKIGNMYKTNPTEAANQFKTMQTQNANQINSVLTPQQQQTWRQMTGNPYAFGPETYFGNNTAGTTPGTTPAAGAK